MTMQVFLNGRGAKQVIFRTADGFIAEGVPKNLVLGPLQGALDELRVSDVQRYTADFAPPAREKEWPVDAHTRALFHFNGTLNGESHGHASPVVGRVEPQ